MEVMRFTAPLAEEDPNGTLIGVEAIAELAEEIHQVYEQSEELYEAAERLAKAVETAIAAGHCGGRKIEKAMEHFKDVTGG